MSFEPPFECRRASCEKIRRGKDEHRRRQPRQEDAYDPQRDAEHSERREDDASDSDSPNADGHGNLQQESSQ